MTSQPDERHQYRRVAADIRSRIMSGEITAGTQLPSIPQLTEDYGAANTTIQRALGALKDEGFLVSRMGKGVYVRDRVQFAVRVGTHFQARPEGYTNQLLNVDQIEPPRPVKTALQLHQDDGVILRHLMEWHDGDPLNLTWSYYPLGIVAGSAIMEPRKVRGGTPKALAGQGYPPRYFTDHVSARMPTTEEYELLELPDDVPVLRQFRVIYSDHDRPVQVVIMVKGAHFWELSYREKIG